MFFILLLNIINSISKPWIHILIIFVFAQVLIPPMCSNTVFSNHVHCSGPNLYFKNFIIKNNISMDRSVSIRFWIRNIIFCSTYFCWKISMNYSENFITISCWFSNYSNCSNIRYWIKIRVSFIYFFPNRIRGFFSIMNFSLYIFFRNKRVGNFF